MKLYSSKKKNVRGVPCSYVVPGEKNGPYLRPFCLRLNHHVYQSLLQCDSKNFNVDVVKDL